MFIEAYTRIFFFSGSIFELCIYAVFHYGPYLLHPFLPSLSPKWGVCVLGGFICFFHEKESHQVVLTGLKFIMYTRLVFNPQRSTYSCLPCARIEYVHYQAQHVLSYFKGPLKYHRIYLCFLIFMYMQNTILFS